MIDFSILTLISSLLMAWPLTSLGIKNNNVIKILGLLMLILSLANIVFGFLFLQDWQPEIPDSRGSKAMIFVPIIKYYPYILIVIGFSWTVLSIKAIRNPKSFLKEIK
tara:strand:- start:46 stop:369 length:324 start_codon:yes stop_codon:yes gene_type:complete